MADLQLEQHGGDVHQALTRAEEQEVRMVLVGKTGAGKSKTGNTILGGKAFKSTIDFTSVTSECKKATGEFEGQSLSVVDTPGLFDTKRSEEEVINEIARCVSFAAPGPHVFLIVIHPGRFTEEEQETVKILQKVFGEESAAYSMVLFTHGDDLEEEEVSIEESINKNPALKGFISQCGGGYIVFNNRDKNPSQVRELLEKINMMVLRNGGRYFNNEMLEEARRAIVEGMRRLLRENLEMKFAEVRRLAERRNAFLQGFLTSTTATGALVGGIAAGAALGAAAGPVGAAVGGVCAAAIFIKREACSIQ